MKWLLAETVQVPVQSTCEADLLRPLVSDVSVALGPYRIREVPLALLMPLQLLARKVAAMLHQVVPSHPVAE